MGLNTVPTITLSHLNEKQKRAYRLADNKIAENGGWNLELLQLEIKDLEQICAGDLDIRITGFNDAELDQIINLGDTVTADPKSNYIPFIPEDEIVSVLGDIWQIGLHILFHAGHGGDVFDPTRDFKDPATVAYPQCLHRRRYRQTDRPPPP